MAKVYATVPGAEVRIDFYGTATNDRPCLVPPAVAEELAKVEGLRVEPDEEAAVTLPPGRYRTAAELNAKLDFVSGGKLKVQAPPEPAPSEKE